MGNEKLKSFANRLRLSSQFVANKTATYFSDNAISSIVEDFNRKQLEGGGDSEGDGLGEYSPQRIEERLAAGKQVDWIDLNFTGEAYERIEARGQLAGNKPSLVIEGLGDKWDSIREDNRFNMAVGLTQKNIDIVGNMLADHLTKELTQYWTV